MGNSRHERWMCQGLFRTALILGLWGNPACAEGPVHLERDEKGGICQTTSVVFSPNGKWLAAMTQSEIMMWDFATKERVATKRSDFRRQFLTITFSLDGQGLVYVEGTGRICVWDGSSGWAEATDRQVSAPNGASKPSHGHLRDSAIVAMSPDGRQLAVARDIQMIEIIELDTGKNIGKLKVDGVVYSLQYTNQGKMLVVGMTGSVDGIPFVPFCNLERLTAAEPLRIETPPRRRLGTANDAELSPTEKILAVVTVGMRLYSEAHTGLYSEVRFRKLANGLWTTLARYEDRVMWHPCFSPDGRLLAVPVCEHRGELGEVQVWDLTANVSRRLDCSPGSARKPILDVAFSPDGRYLVGGLAHPDVAVCIWDLREDADKSGSD